MNAAINPENMVSAISDSENVLDLTGLEQVFYHPTFLKLINENCFIKRSIKNRRC